MAPEQLMLLYQKGDAEAFDALYAQFAPRVRGFLLSRLSSPARADEALQSVFLKLHRARHSYKKGEPFAPWLFTITQNTLRDSLRAESRNPARPDEQDPEVILGTLASVGSPGEEANASGLLERLDGPSRELLEWRYGRELSFEQIASRIGISAAGARQRVSRAIRKLRQEMTRKGESS